MQTQDAPLSGDIKYFRLPEVLQLLALQRLTGRLTLSRAGQTVEVFVQDGNVAFATDEKRREREQLGVLLVNMGRLTAGTLDAALELCARTGDKLGKVLVDEKLATRDDITAALRKQTERSVYRAMAWGEGRFVFEFSEMPGFVKDMPVELRVENLILEGVRLIGEVRVISEKIPSRDIVFARPAYSEQEIAGLGLKEEERLVLSLVDGKADVKGLIKASGMAEFSLLRVLYALYSAGIIKKLDLTPRTYRTQYL